MAAKQTVTRKRVNIFLDDELHTKAKIIAVLKDTTLNQYIEQAIEQAVKKDSGLLEMIKKRL